MADPNKYAQFLRDPDQQALDEFNRIEAQGQRPWYQTALPMEGRATFLPFRDTLEGSVFNQRELALPGIVAGAVNAFTAPERARTGSDATFNPNEEALNFAQNVMGGGIGTSAAMKAPMGQGGKNLALNAYHGTPHEIKGGFDISKVGTGEGAQAYGHGIYFAENPEVAHSYKVGLSSPNQFLYRDIENILPDVLKGKAADFSDAIYNGKKFNDLLKEVKLPWQKTLLKQNKDALEGIIQKTQSTGNLYKVDIPDEQIPMMLDWDKPINEQSPKVMEALQGIDKLLPEIPNFNMGKWMEAGPLASTWHNAIIRDLKLSPQEIADILKNKGVAGIRYLDEVSRGTGKGTSNFVVFDPKTVKILEKNDVPVDRKELLQEQFDKLSK